MDATLISFFIYFYFHAFNFEKVEGALLSAYPSIFQSVMPTLLKGGFMNFKSYSLWV